jgi:hypothetical protein
MLETYCWPLPKESQDDTAGVLHSGSKQRINVGSAIQIIGPFHAACVMVEGWLLAHWPLILATHVLVNPSTGPDRIHFSGSYHFFSTYVIENVGQQYAENLLFATKVLPLP